MALFDLMPGHLVIFVDDTGHERLAGNQQYYGLGGAIFLAETYESHIKPAWRHVRQLINGDPELPLHASQMNARSEAYGPLAHFFSIPFFRFAVTTVAAAETLPPNWATMQPVFEMIKAYIAQLAALMPYYEAAALLVESSTRADPLLMQYFGELQLMKDGRLVEADHCLLPKRANEPGLEIADFISNAAGSVARGRLRGSDKLPPDFRAVFHSIPFPMTRYMHIESVKGNDNGNFAEGLGLAPTL